MMDNKVNKIVILKPGLSFIHFDKFALLLMRTRQNISTRKYVRHNSAD